MQSFRGAVAHIRTLYSKLASMLPNNDEFHDRHISLYMQVIVRARIRPAFRRLTALISTRSLVCVLRTSAVCSELTARAACERLMILYVQTRAHAGAAVSVEESDFCSVVTVVIPISHSCGSRHGDWKCGSGKCDTVKNARVENSGVGKTYGKPNRYYTLRDP